MILGWWVKIQKWVACLHQVKVLCFNCNFNLVIAGNKMPCDAYWHSMVKCKYGINFMTIWFFQHWRQWRTKMLNLVLFLLGFFYIYIYWHIVLFCTISGSNCTMLSSDEFGNWSWFGSQLVIKGWWLVSKPDKPRTADVKNTAQSKFGCTWLLWGAGCKEIWLSFIDYSKLLFWPFNKSNQYEYLLSFSLRVRWICRQACCHLHFRFQPFYFNTPGSNKHIQLLSFHVPLRMLRTFKSQNDSSMNWHYIH